VMRIGVPSGGGNDIGGSLLIGLSGVMQATVSRLGNHGQLFVRIY
jgi:hypothetical protein